jgi:hypothetical protein
MSFPPLQQPQVEARYEPENQIVYVRYTGVLGSDASDRAYTWLAELINKIGIENIYGEIFDFTQVTQFQPDNIINARKNSRKLNLRVNIHETPVAMIVRDAVQEEILRGPMRNVPENKRKRIVHSDEEALAFFEEWHKQIAE